MGTSNLNHSRLAQYVRQDNFTPQLSQKLVTGTTSLYITFSPLTGQMTSTFEITNKGTKGCYVAWASVIGGQSPPVAIASTSNGVTVAGGPPTATGTSSCHYIAAGVIKTINFQSAFGTVDSIAAIQGSDSQDSGTTTLEISYGFGQ